MHIYIITCLRVRSHYDCTVRKLHINQTTSIAYALICCYNLIACTLLIFFFSLRCSIRFDTNASETHQCVDRRTSHPHHFQKLASTKLFVFFLLSLAQLESRLDKAVSQMNINSINLWIFISYLIFECVCVCGEIGNDFALGFHFVLKISCVLSKKRI